MASPFFWNLHFWGIIKMKKQYFSKLNKKGFSLVELIIVIAIMAVLAGTISGIAVTELNKQKDKNNYNVQASLYARSVAACLYPGNVIRADFYGATAETADKFDAAKIMHYLSSEIASAQSVTWDNVNEIPDKGMFSLCVNNSGDRIYIAYTGIRKNFGTKYYTVYPEGSYEATGTMDLDT